MQSEYRRKQGNTYCENKFCILKKGGTRPMPDAGAVIFLIMVVELTHYINQQTSDGAVYFLNKYCIRNMADPHAHVHTQQCTIHYNTAAKWRVFRKNVEIF